MDRTHKSVASWLLLTFCFLAETSSGKHAQFTKPEVETSQMGRNVERADASPWDKDGIAIPNEDPPPLGDRIASSHPWNSYGNPKNVISTFNIVPMGEAVKVSNNAIPPSHRYETTLTKSKTNKADSNKEENGGVHGVNMRHRLLSGDGLLHQEAFQPYQPPECDSQPHKCAGDRSFNDPQLFHSRLNKFACPPCNCTAGHVPRADCRGVNLTNIPSTLPPGIRTLDMSQNPVRNLSIDSIAQYPNLATFTLSRCRRLTRISNESDSRETLAVLDLDLRQNAILNVDDNSFHVMSSLLILHLASNSLQKISNKTFNGLANLQILDLSHNKISDISIGAFDSLIQLRTLNLSNNPRLSYSAHRMPPRLFLNLKSLTHLYIQGSSRDNERYPNSALATLTNLNFLSIDALRSSARLGPELKSLTNLQYLDLGSFGGWCHLVNITETYFENVPHVIFLGVNKCTHLVHAHLDAYKTMPNLTTLTITYGSQNYGLFQAFESLKGLQNSSLKFLTLSHMIHHSPPCVFLTGDQAVYLQHISLESLDLSSNNIALLQQDFIEMLPTTLKKLVLRDNAFTTRTFRLSRLSLLSNLEQLDVSDQNIGKDHHILSSSRRALQPKCPGIINQTGRRTAQQRGNKTSFHMAWYSPSLSHPDTCTATCRNIFSNVFVEGDVGSFFIPPKLKYLKAYRFINFALDLFLLDIKSNNVLEEIELSNSYMDSWGYGKMINSIVLADFSKNYCVHIAKDFFQVNNSVKQLSLVNNFLGPDFADDKDGEIFQHLNKAHTLDLRRNVIYHLPPNFFSGLTKLRTLILSDNKLQNLNTSFATTRDLRYIDASKNSIFWVGRETRADLDTLARRHGLSLDLTLNPLPCSCDGLEIIAWLDSTPVTLLNADFLSCQEHGGRVERLGAVRSRLRALQAACAPRTVLLAVTAASCVFVVTTVGLALLYRYRWRLLYLRNVALARWLGYRHGDNDANGQRDAYPFDAYVVHSERSSGFVLGELRQQLATRRGHKLCIPDLHFMPGSMMVTDIVAAVRQSSVTLVVVTPDVAQDAWAEYSVKMALSEEHFQRREALFLLLLDLGNGDGDMAGDDADVLVQDLLYVKQRGSFLELPPRGEHGVTEDVTQSAWDRLSQRLGHTTNTEERDYVEG